MDDELLEMLSGINVICEDAGFFKLTLIDTTNRTKICTINNILKKEYSDMEKKSTYLDVIRILEKFGFTQEGTRVIKQKKYDQCCCQDVNERHKKRALVERIKTFIPKNIVENYLFIGSLSPEDIFYDQTNGIDCILFEDSEFKVAIGEEDIGGIHWYYYTIQEYKEEHFYGYSSNMLEFLYIGDYIPEELKISSKFNKNIKLYGIYNDECVIWSYKNINDRFQWVYNIF